jgi:hypothetical protein
MEKRFFGEARPRWKTGRISARKAWHGLCGYSLIRCPRQLLSDDFLTL